MRWIGAASVAMALACAAQAQPGNDLCGANRAAYTVPGSGAQVSGNLTNATRDGSACAGSTGQDAYFYFTPASAGPWRFSLCPTVLPFDSVISIHTNSCPVSNQNYATGFAASSCNDDSTGVFACSSTILSQIDSVLLTPGTPYIIRVARFQFFNNAPTNFMLSVVDLSTVGACCQTSGACVLQSAVLCAAPATFRGAGTACSPNPCPQTPANDLCGNAIAMAGSGFDVMGSNVLANTDGAAICGDTGSRDVWYRFTPAMTGAYSVSLCTTATPWDAVLSVHTGCPGTAANQVGGACNDDGCSGQIGLPTVPAVTLAAGTPYLIRVAGYGTAGSHAAAFRLIVGPAEGRCCDPASGACLVTPQGNCPAPSVWTGGAVCLPTSCDAFMGACCNPGTGACEARFASQCGGSWSFQGAGTSCSPNPCPPPITGACCDPGGCCTFVAQSACSHTFIASSPCVPSPCGAAPVNDLCADAAALSMGVAISATTCGATSPGDGPDPSCLGVGGGGRGVWYAITPPAEAAFTISTCGSGHDTVLTVFSGGCGTLTEIACNDDAAVTCAGGDVRAAEIAGLVLLAGETYLVRVWSVGDESGGGGFALEYRPEAALGACCLSDGSCAPTDQANCEGPLFSPGAACSPTPCPQPTGACCWPNGTCVSATAAECGGSFQGEQTVCSPNPCPQPTGACCAGSTCSTTTAAECQGAARMFAGAGTLCNAPGNLTSPCCLADFNQSGAISVQDLFDFLAAYFSGSALADLNASGSTTVQDIFDFLAAYFRGGC